MAHLHFFVGTLKLELLMLPYVQVKRLPDSSSFFILLHFAHAYLASYSIMQAPE